ncbi:MAG TPA: GNAT family N-acetyltransferase [Jatrophihabitans sp.]|jgi:GNAT superfamily N-acetyltransferase|uniref:GNAT family N-acetyltransferase n=1 Tax=Jatrophihabitans sp. TaxID=1932789 RepID=UPI002F20779B
MRYRGSRYRRAGLLPGLIVLGWIWDCALGGGRAHAPAWLGALIIVGGISLLAARGATDPSPPEPAGPATPAATGPIVIEPATPADLPRLVEVEVAADTLFAVAGYGSTPGPASVDELASARLLLVARRQPSHPPSDPAATNPAPDDPEPVGYIRVEIVDGQPHIEGMSVRPKQMRRGIGTALVDAACHWATEQGYSQITLCTFGDVPWNGPFYARLGFTEIPAPSPALRALRQREVRLGLDGMGRRCVMRRPLGEPPDDAPAR